MHVDPKRYGFGCASSIDCCTALTSGSTGGREAGDTSGKAVSPAAAAVGAAGEAAPDEVGGEAEAASEGEAGAASAEAAGPAFVGEVATPDRTGLAPATIARFVGGAFGRSFTSATGTVGSLAGRPCVAAWIRAGALAALGGRDWLAATDVSEPCP